MSPKPQTRLSETDQSLLDLIRHQGSASIADLCDSLQVTATAVRQRLSRLVAADFLRSVKVKQERGRPLHVYQLTPLGLQTMGENLSDLAEALWAEVTAIPDFAVRQSVMEGVLQRLVNKYRSQILGTTVTERLTSIASLFHERGIPFVVEVEDSQASLRIVGCPYPRLNEHGDEICRFEQRLVGELLDLPVALKHCRCDSSGGKCCTFSAQMQTELNQITVKQSKTDTVSS